MMECVDRRDHFSIRVHMVSISDILTRERYTTSVYMKEQIGSLTTEQTQRALLIFYETLPDDVSKPLRRHRGLDRRTSRKGLKDVYQRAVKAAGG